MQKKCGIKKTHQKLRSQAFRIPSYRENAEIIGRNYDEKQVEFLNLALKMAARKQLRIQEK